MYLLVVLMIKIDFIWDKDVEEHGVGNVERNTALLILTLKLGKNVKMPKIIIMHYVVVKNQASNKKTIVLVGTVITVERDGTK